MLWRLSGSRLRPELAADYETLATLLSATMRGLVVTAQSSPSDTTYRTVASPFGAAESGEWSLPALGLASVAMAFLEPDPDVEWDDERLAQIHRILDAWQPPDSS